MSFLKRIDIFYIVTLLFLLVSANANFLSSSDIWWSVILVFMILVAIGKKLLLPQDLRFISIFSLVYLVIVTARDLAINGLGADYLVSEAVFLVKFIFMAFIYCTILKDKAAAYIVNVMVHLTLLSFFFYFFQLLDLGDYIYKYSSALNLPSNNFIPGYTNFLLFTFTKGVHDYSNSGFVWEPGSFGCFLIISLMLNFFLNKFTFDRKSNILLFGIITTFATTDYLTLLVLLFLVYRYRVKKLNFVAVAFLLVAVGIIFVVPILGNKIADTYYEDMDDLNRLKALEVFYHHRNMQIPLNRFSSMVYIFNTFGANLILGVTNKYEVIMNKAYSINISNGLFDFLAKFGLVGLIGLLYQYGRFCLAYVLKIEFVIYCIVMLLVMGFGEPVLILPLFLMFIFIQKKQTDLDPREKKRKKSRGLHGSANIATK